MHRQMMSDYDIHSPIATLAGQCYFCRVKTHFMYKAVRLCSKHDTEENRKVIDVQNAHLKG